MALARRFYPAGRNASRLAELNDDSYEPRHRDIMVSSGVGVLDIRTARHGRGMYPGYHHLLHSD